MSVAFALSQLLKQDDLSFDPMITGITSDSRSVRSGFLFVAIGGVRVDGRAFIRDAIQNGAVAIIVEPHTARPEIEDVDWSKIAWIEHEQTRLLLAKLASRFYDVQPETIFAVTGTNGKTSTVNFVRQILQKMNLRAVSLGTLGLDGADYSGRATSMTTLDPVHLHALFADLVAQGVSHVAMEASSHGLHQYRLHGVKIFAGAFTNLTHDHLDYHKTMDEYRAAKAILFKELVRSDGYAVLNADSDEFNYMKSICDARGIQVISYGRHATDLILLGTIAESHGTKTYLNLYGQEMEMTFPLVGEFQIYNLLCAVGLVTARCPKRLQEVIDILPQIHGVIGRLQFVQSPKPDMPAVYVDYAHTPDALTQILTSLRPHTNGKIICLFGCGGDRDKSKRPIMGRIASALADIVVVTDDNPRSENPDDIRAEILVEAPDAVSVAGRRDAIHLAISLGGIDDIVVIAGKGHEQGQIIGDVVEPFDDVEEAHAYLTSGDRLTA
jgi:UDP-N-acetylmuramoyl-L-alanyl-D-glutamate--2,6-diaminopimelate ligase